MPKIVFELFVSNYQSAFAHGDLVIKFFRLTPLIDQWFPTIVYYTITDFYFHVLLMSRTYSQKSNDQTILNLLSYGASLIILFNFIVLVHF